MRSYSTANVAGAVVAAVAVAIAALIVVCSDNDSGGGVTLEHMESRLSSGRKTWIGEAPKTCGIEYPVCGT